MQPHQQGSRPTDSARKRLRAALALLVGWKAPRFETFCDRFDPVADWWETPGPEQEGDAYEFVTDAQRRSLNTLHGRDPDDILEEMDQWAGQVIVVGDDDYPQRLHDLSRPPAALHLLGELDALHKEGLAVVGSRDIPVSAASSARQILLPVARRGVSIISGGALGADAVAHRSAVVAEAATVVVLPSGVHNPTPKSNRRLFRDVVDAGGALISEYPPQQGVRRYHFRRRNSLIAALSRAVLVVRAGAKSGTMLTVDAARRLDRPLAAIPGAPDDPLAVGCHQVLRDGGRLIAGDGDLMQWCMSLMPGSMADDSDDDEEETTPLRPDCEILEAAESILDSNGAFSLDQLARCTDQSAAQLQTTLLTHELSGVIQRVAGGGKYRFCGN